MKFAKSIITGIGTLILAGLFMGPAQAQVTYTYTGANFNTIGGNLWSARDRITVTLTTPGVLPASYANSSSPYNSCPAGTLFTIGAGSVTVLSTDSNSIAYNCYFQTDAQKRIVKWNFQLGTIAEPEYYFTTLSLNDSHDLAQYFSMGESYGLTLTPGIWASPSAQNITTALLGHLTGDLNIPGLGNSLVAQVTTVLNDLNNGTLGLACSDLQDFANHVKAQTGNKITTAQAKTIMQWVGWIADAIPGCRVN